MAGEKLYEATPSRLERARREGDVAKSQELCAVAAFAAALGATVVGAPLIAGALHAAMSQGLHARFAPAEALVIALSLIPACAGAGAAVLAGVAQTGGLHLVSLAPRLDRLNPSENLKRMLSREAAVHALRATAAFCCAGLAVAAILPSIIGLSLQSSGASGLIVAAWNGSWQGAAATCAVAMIFAGADYALQHNRRRTRLRMSAEEFKRDRKEHEGDPLARSRRRAMHRQIARGSLQRVKKASFVVVNPTHVAVALQYNPPDVPVPKVLVRAADAIAVRVREIAAEEEIPIVENAPLARSLYAMAQPGEFIPHELYVAVAEIVAALGAAA